MAQWLKNVVMIIVMLAWLAFCVTQLIRGVEVPLPVWSVPGATYALLSNRVPRIGFKDSEEEK